MKYQFNIPQEEFQKIKDESMATLENRTQLRELKIGTI